MSILLNLPLHFDSHRHTRCPCYAHCIQVTAFFSVGALAVVFLSFVLLYVLIFYVHFLVPTSFLVPPNICCISRLGGRTDVLTDGYNE